MTKLFQSKLGKVVSSFVFTGTVIALYSLNSSAATNSINPICKTKPTVSSSIEDKFLFESECNGKENKDEKITPEKEKPNKGLELELSKDSSTVPEVDLSKCSEDYKKICVRLGKVFNVKKGGVVETKGKHIKQYLVDSILNKKSEICADQEFVDSTVKLASSLGKKELDHHVANLGSIYLGSKRKCETTIPIVVNNETYNFDIKKLTITDSKNTTIGLGIFLTSLDKNSDNVRNGIDTIIRSFDNVPNINEMYTDRHPNTKVSFDIKKYKVELNMFTGIVGIGPYKVTFDKAKKFLPNVKIPNLERFIVNQN